MVILDNLIYVIKQKTDGYTYHGGQIECYDSDWNLVSIVEEIKNETQIWGLTSNSKGQLVIGERNKKNFRIKVLK